MGNFNLTNLAVNMYCPGNAAQLDDAGLPSIMVWIPAFRLCDVLNTTDESIHPAFIVNGVQIPGFWYSKYENVVHNGRAYSLPGEDPMANIRIDECYEYCDSKGYGWHLSTAVEWAAIALWCKKNGFLPRGNNNYGRDHAESNVKAIPTYTGSDNKVGRVATGTGPLSWSHDNTMSGIWDLNGNVWEWQGGLRLVWGELQLLANNDSADTDNPQNEASSCWKAIDAASGALVDPESKTTDAAVRASGNTVKLDYVNNVWTYSTGISSGSISARQSAFANFVCSEEIGEQAKILLRALAVLPDAEAGADDYSGDRVWVKNGINECVSCRGGNWMHGSNSGLFSFSWDSGRNISGVNTGFRAAYIPNI